MKDLLLKSEVKTFTDRNGNLIDYVNFYVEVNGIKIKMKPVDQTGKQVLEFYLKKGGNN